LQFPAECSILLSSCQGQAPPQRVIMQAWDCAIWSAGRHAQFFTQKRLQIQHINKAVFMQQTDRHTLLCHGVHQT
jgi:hypothetical protein